ncbi:hypothetical protein V8B97DRAFT_1962709 [Scleroderma yunnanense]
MALEVNAFDQLGCTVLHLALSSTDAASTEYARMLLAHPNINVNILDKENHWTALHRNMYAWTNVLSMRHFHQSHLLNAQNTPIEALRYCHPRQGSQGIYCV